MKTGITARPELPDVKASHIDDVMDCDVQADCACCPGRVAGVSADGPRVVRSTCRHGRTALVDIDRLSARTDKKTDRGDMSIKRGVKRAALFALDHPGGLALAALAVAVVGWAAQRVLWLGDAPGEYTHVWLDHLAVVVWVLSASLAMAVALILIMAGGAYVVSSVVRPWTRRQADAIRESMEDR